MGAPARTFVLVAGAWHGAWCWGRVAALLASAGHRVLTPELPGTGGDATDPARITLETWARFISEVVAAEDSPLLVGHSRAGIVISRAAELAPGRIGLLVYLSAYLLPSGATMAAEARADPGSLVPANMIPAAGGVTCMLDPAMVREAFYGDCDAQTVAFASERLAPEPLKPLVSPVRVTGERFGSLPRAYIECTRDRTVSLACQRRMQAALPCDPVITLQSDHSPFLSHPDELAAALDGLSGRF
jgi:pimeloyl-ACP methyl ester carboxylesterase